MRRIAVAVSHPIQHFCPQYESWAGVPDVEILILFHSKKGLESYVDPGFGRTVQWSALSLAFPHKFLDRSTENLADALARFAPDVLIIYGYTEEISRAALSWALRHNRPVAMIADSELRSHRALWKRMAKKALLPRVFQRVDRFLTVGDANEAYYRHFGVPDCKLIRSFFPIDIKAYDVAVADNTAQRARLRARLAIPDAHTVLLMVGKFVPWKRQEDLIRFSNSQGSDAFTVVLAGSGGLEDHLRRTARRVGPGGVIFAGFVPPEDLPQYYLAADLYTHCAEHEPHSLAVSEAIYCGLPAIVSDRSGSYGPTDDVRVGENGFVYRCGNVPALTSYIKVIRAAPKLMDSMKQASLEISRANQRLAHGRVLRHLLDSLAVNLQS